nr:olfactory receptor 38 [Tropidothorax elegans]
MIVNLMTVQPFFSSALKHFILALLRKRLKALIVYIENEIAYDGTDMSGMKMTIIYGAIVGFTSLIWVFNGLILKGDLLFDENFPWDESKGIGFIAALAFQSIACIYCWFQHVTLDTIPTVACHKMYNSIDKLKSMLAHVGSHGDDEIYFLKSVAILHLKILVGARHVNNTYKHLLLFQIIYLVIHSCCISYCAIKNDNYGFVISSLIPMLLSAYTQLFIYAKTGQILTSKLEELGDSCYCSQWYLTSPENKKIIAMIMMEMQKPVEFSSFGITAALYSTYLKCVQESISYFIFLRTMESVIVEKSSETI